MMADSMGLIQMNVHMVRTDIAITLMGVSSVLAIILFVYFVVSTLEYGIQLKHIIMEIVAFIVLAALFTFGLKMPMKRQIHACAAGAVSIEQIAARYDVVDVDGKLITLIER